MGYTHYWEHDTITNDEWNELTTLVKKICEASALTVNYEISDIEIFVNGKNDPYEDFVLTPEKVEFEFCKTNSNSYDPVVVAILIAARHVLGKKFEWRSDGVLSDGDFDEGMTLFQQIVGLDIISDDMPS